MDFAYPETHTEIKNLALTIFQDFGAPERLKKLEANGPYFDKELWQQMIESGLISASMPESISGMELDYAASALVCEAIGQTMVSTPFIPCMISTALPLLEYMEQIKDDIVKVLAGETLLTTAFIEPFNEDPFKPETTIKHGEISGTKHCVPFAKDSSKVLISATNGSELWVGLVALDQNSVLISEQHATSEEPQYKIEFNHAVAQTLATGEKAEALLQKSIAMTQVAYCSMACGISKNMTKISGEYTSQREQFGVPIATFQAVSHRLANSYIDGECLSIITLKAISDVSTGDYNNESIAMAKVWCGDVLHRVSQASQHVHGGTGIDKDYHLFRYCLWAKQLELSLGHSKIHLANLADQLAKKYLAAATI